MEKLTQEDLFQREKELNLVIEISEAVISQLHLEDLFKLVVEYAQRLIGAETVLIPILDKNQDSYTYKAGCGKNAEEIVGESLPIEFGICGWVWKNKKPWWRGVLDLLNEDERNKWEKDAGTVILVPLQGKEHFHGGIVGINKINGGDFTRRDLDLLTMFASQVSIAIENANAFEQLEEAKARAEGYETEVRELNNKLIAANKELENLALYDHLTGIPNRSLFQDRLEQSIINAKKKDSMVAVFMLDLDRFKEVNDSLGHKAGDELLQEISLRLQGVFSEQVTYGRLGGDEFALIVPEYSPGEQDTIAEKIKNAFVDPFSIDGNQILVNASIGIAFYPEHGQDVSTLLKNADVAMYACKKTKSRYSVYNFSEDTFTKDRLALVNELKNAINTNELILYFQPKIDVQSEKIMGVEALARWPHPKRGMIMPDLFIPLMERSGMYREFTIWVLENALSSLANWQKKGLNLELSINISMYNLRDPLFSDVLCGVIKKYGIHHHTVILEITESEVMGDIKMIPKVIAHLSNKGIQFSIDDFGTGYSSLTHLKKLQVDELKIDKSFVMGMKTDKEDEVIVRSTIDLGHNLGLRVVAEGVEDKETLEKLLTMGPDAIQGYYYSKPLMEQDLILFYNNSLEKEQE